MTTTFCTSGAVKLRAGANVSTALTDTQYTMLINEAECFINVALKDGGVDYVTTFSGLGTNVKCILEEAAACIAAIGAINYNMGGYTSRQEALTMLNVNWALGQECIKRLEDKKYTDYLKGT